MAPIDLVRRISTDPEAFAEVIDAYEDKLMRYISRMSDLDYTDRENLLQDIFIRVYRNIYEYDERYSFSSWIYRIAHNMIIDNYRKNQKSSQDISLDDQEYSSIVDTLTDGNSPHIDLEKNDIRECVKRAILALPIQQREVILLKCIDGYSYEEISDILRIPIGTSSTLVNRGRAQLRENLKKLHCNP